MLRSDMTSVVTMVPVLESVMHTYLPGATPSSTCLEAKLTFSVTWRVNRMGRTLPQQPAYGVGECQSARLRHLGLRLLARARRALDLIPELLVSCSFTKPRPLLGERQAGTGNREPSPPHVTRKILIKAVPKVRAGGNYPGADQLNDNLPA